jgi:hypothetical protein
MKPLLQFRGKWYMDNQLKFWFLMMVSSLLLIGGCGSDEERTPESAGKIVVEAATKGTQQYLIEINNQRYWPENLPQEYQQPINQDLEVLLRFTERDAQKEIYLPSPNDIPVFAYTVPVIHILEIRRK